MFWVWTIPTGFFILIVLVDVFQRLQKRAELKQVDRDHRKVMDALTEEEHNRIDQALKLFYAGKIDAETLNYRVTKEHRAAAERAGVRNWC